MNPGDANLYGPANPGYDATFFEPLFQVEDRHFWFRARNYVIRALMRRITGGYPAGFRALEIGCGTGNVLRSMVEACPGGSVVGMDLYPDGLRIARRRTTAALIQGDLQHPPFNTRFQLVGLFDVIEHLEDDLGALIAVRDLLKPDGTVLITVPAFHSLWSYFDEVSCHFRRYQPDELESRLTQAGFRIEFLTPYMATLFPLAWLQRRLAGRQKATPDPSSGITEFIAQEFRIVPVINEVMRMLCQAEAPLIGRNLRLPVGTSLIAVATRF